MSKCFSKFYPTFADFSKNPIVELKKDMQNKRHKWEVVIFKTSV